MIQMEGGGVKSMIVFTFEGFSIKRIHYLATVSTHLY